MFINKGGHRIVPKRLDHNMPSWSRFVSSLDVSLDIIVTCSVASVLFVHNKTAAVQMCFVTVMNVCLII